MANCCYTMYRLYGDRAKELSNDIKKVQERHKNEDGTWLKWLATDLLGYTNEQISKGEIYVRGNFIPVCDDATEDELMFDTDTAWNPCNELFYELAEKYELDIYWMADERGLVGVWSNDVEHHVWDWEYVIYNDRNGLEEYFSDEEDAVAWVNEDFLTIGFPPIEHLADLQKDEYQEHEIFVTEIEYVEE